MSWRDALLHIPMGAAFATVIALPFVVLTPLTFWQAASPALFAAAPVGWLREATQWQEDEDNRRKKAGMPELTWKFFRGWRETALREETWVPIVALGVGGLLTWLKLL